MPVDKFRGVSLQRELMNTIEEYIKNHPEMGYQSLADFVRDAVRDKCDRLNIMLPKPALPMLEHFNLNETGVRVLDRSLRNGTSTGKIIDIYFKPNKVWCSHCQSENCNHIAFAVSLPQVKEILAAKGWKVNQ